MNPTKSRRGRGGRSTNRQRFSSNSRSPRRGSFSNGRSHHSGGNYHRRGRGGGGRKRQSFDPSRFINTNPVELEPEVFTPKNSFDTFGLDMKLAQNINSMGITIPTPIQDKIIPEILLGNDVIGLAETGTGKTAAFLVPIINKTIKDPNRQTLILAPTRELALQIDTELQRLSRGMRMLSVVCVGGVGIIPQIRMLKRDNHFIIGTPGRVLDLINRGDFKTSGVKTVVLDEADRMLDMGFIHDMRKILSGIQDDREMLFFSATMPADAKKLVHDFLHNPVEISVKKKDITNTIEQNVVRYKKDDKYETLHGLLKGPEFSRVLVFGSMKHSVERLSRQLSKSGVSADSIHGNKAHGQRQRALGKFKRGEVNVLVATDVAARGIHVEDVSHVINYDLPNTFEDYVHRIGRTGRATKKGKALTFVPEKF